MWLGLTFQITGLQSMQENLSKVIISSTLSVCLAIMPAHRLEASPDCAEFAASVWFDHASSTWLNTDSLAYLAKLSERELSELDPGAELESLKTVWQSIQLMAASEKARLQGIAEAKAHFVDAASKDNEYLEKLQSHFHRLNHELSAEKSLLTLSERLGLIGEQRISTKEWSELIKQRINEVNFGTILERYLGENRSLFFYVANSAGAVPFRRWLMSGILDRNSDFLSTMQSAYDSYSLRVQDFGQQIQTGQLDSSQLIEIAQALYFHINWLEFGLAEPDTLLSSVFDRYAHQMLSNTHPETLAVKLGKTIQDVEKVWQRSMQVISQSAPDSIKPLIPLVYFLRNQISTARTQEDFISSLILFDIFTNPPSVIANTIQDPDSFFDLIARSPHVRFGGYLGERHVVRNSDSRQIWDGVSLGFAVLQMAYLVANVAGVVPLPRWLIAFMLIFTLIIKPYPAIRPR